MFAIRCFARRYSSQVSRKRFYKDVSIVSSSEPISALDSQESFEICLDTKKLRTPKNTVLKVPTESLARAIAQEWDMQRPKIAVSRMHLTGLAITATDNPMKVTKESVTDLLLQYLEHDTVFFMSTEPEALRVMQENQWGTLIRWAAKAYGIDIETTDSILGPSIPEDCLKTIRQHFLSYNLWSLIGYQYAVEAVKSVIISLATVDCRISVDKAIKLSCLEAEYQQKFWGRVEWAHDMEYHELASRLAAAVLFIHLTSGDIQTRLVSQHQAIRQ